MLDILLHLDHRQRMPEALVLDNNGVADTLVLAEDAGREASDLSIGPPLGLREVVKINILTAQTSERSFRYRMICLRSYDMVSCSLT
jgi:hypothetical protein